MKLSFYLTSVVLIIAIPFSYFCMDVQLDGDSNIYKFILLSLEELKLRQLSETLGIQYGPTANQHSSICYDDLGCFDKNGTFKHLKQLPDPPETVGTQFLLYTQNNLYTPQIIDYNKPNTIYESHFDGSRPVKFITHGFGGRNNITWVWNMKNAFLEKENVNVIIVDWSLGSKAPYYIQAAVNSELVGAQIAALFYFLKDNLGVDESKLHAIGFSLGAHVAGFVGKRMLEMRGTKPSRITGLDPASPFFEDYGCDVHLCKDDADFVDVIHTNADLTLFGGLGMEVPIGHADFYPNGGKRQPGCGSTLMGAIKDVINGERERACNHERAVHLFTESILDPTSCEFLSFPCESYSDLQMAKCLRCDNDKPCTQMGYKSQGKGSFYLMTRESRPYCADNIKLSFRFSKKVKKSHGSLILTLVGHDGEKEIITLTKKDEKLSPGKTNHLAIRLDEKMKPIQEIKILYHRYNGWFVKGTPTYTIEAISLHDANGNILFSNCDDIVLHDKKYTSIINSGAKC